MYIHQGLQALTRFIKSTLSETELIRLKETMEKPSEAEKTVFTKDSVQNVKKYLRLLQCFILMYKNSFRGHKIITT